MQKYKSLIAIIAILLGAFVLGGNRLQPPAVNGQMETITPMETITIEGVSMYQEVGEGWYVSDVLAPPIPFNALVAEWTDDHTLYFEIRTGTDATWSPWIPLVHSHDLSDGEIVDEKHDDLAMGDMIFVPAEDVTHRSVQIRTNAPISAIPMLKLTAIDSTQGPTGEELLQRQQALDGLVAADTPVGLTNPKPTVVSRDVWCTDARCECPPEGCNDSCLDTDPLRYQEVTHMTVHHTVSSNSRVNWAATVRAIWNFHAFGRCWGDVGYNYLIDMNGVIYEGHRVWG